MNRRSLFAIGAVTALVVALLPTFAAPADAAVAPPQVTISQPAPDDVYPLFQPRAVIAVFSCTAADGATLKPGVAGCGASVDGGTPFEPQPLGVRLDLPYGLHSIKVTATDTGNRTTTKTNSFTIAPMPVPVLAAPQDNQTLRFGSTPRVIYGCSRGSTELKPGLAGCSASIDGGAPVANFTAIPGNAVGNHSIRITATNVDGLHTFTDANYAVASPPPSAAITAPKDGLTYQAASLPHAAFSCLVNKPNIGMECVAFARAVTTPVGLPGTQVASGDALPTAPGEYDLLVEALRDDRQDTVAVVHYAVTAGAPGPSVSASSPGLTGVGNPDQPGVFDAGPTFLAGAVPNATFSCSAGAGSQLKPGLTGCSMSIDGGAQQAGGTPLTNTVGMHVAVITATQADGQHISLYRRYTVIEPVGALPDGTITTPAEGATYLEGAIPNAAYSCQAGYQQTLTQCFGRDNGIFISSGDPIPATLGEHTFEVIGTDADHQFSSVVRHYTVVAPKPSVSVVSPAEGATYAVGGLPNANFSCTAAANLALLPGTGGCGMQVDGGAVQASGTALPDSVGAHTAVVTATQNNQQTTTVTRHYTVVAGPTAAITTPADGTTYPLSSSLPAAAFSCTPAPGGTLKAGLAGCSATIDGGSAVGSGAALAGGLGAHTIAVTATQTNGLSSVLTNHYTVSNNPTVVVTTPTENAVYPFDSVPNVSFTCTAGVGEVIDQCFALYDGSFNVVESGTPLLGTVGPHTVAVNTIDDHGHGTVVSVHYSVTALPPIASLNQPADLQDFAPDSVPNAVFACTPGGGGVLKDGLAGCSASIDGGDPVSSPSALAASLGPHTVGVTATQTNGQSDTVIHFYTVSPAPPSVTVSAPKQGAQYTVGSVPKLGFTCSAGSGGGPLKDALAGCSATVDGGAPVASGAALADSVGQHTVTVIAGQSDDQTKSVTREYTVKAQSGLTAHAAKATLTGSLRLSATLHTKAGAGIAGAPVAFSAKGTKLCTATTAASGAAHCTLTGAHRATALRVGAYSAKFAGNATYLPATSTAHASLLTIQLPHRVPAHTGRLHGVPAHSTPGARIKLTVSGFAPGTHVAFGIYSDPHLLGRASVNAAGSAHITLTIPKTRRGRCTLLAMGAGPSYGPRYLAATTTVAHG